MSCGVCSNESVECKLDWLVVPDALHLLLHERLHARSLLEERVGGVEVEIGVLVHLREARVCRVDLEVVLPDEKRPRKIKINTKFNEENNE